MTLIEQTKQLIGECDASTERFFKMREMDATPLFFDEVKPYADRIQENLKDWQQAANDWIRINQPKYVHEVQIANVVDAMNQFVVQSFYKETSKKRITQSIQSVHYTLSNFLRFLEEGEKNAIK